MSAGCDLVRQLGERGPGLIAEEETFLLGSVRKTENRSFGTPFFLIGAFDDRIVPEGVITLPVILREYLLRDAFGANSVLFRSSRTQFKSDTYGLTN